MRISVSMSYQFANQCIESFCNLTSFLTCSFLDNHPEYVREGVNRSQFSFQIPKPLDDNYVKKRTRPVKRRKSSKDNNCEKGKK